MLLKLPYGLLFFRHAFVLSYSGNVKTMMSRKKYLIHNDKLKEGFRTQEQTLTCRMVILDPNK